MGARDELRKYVHLLADPWTPPATTEERVERLYAAVAHELAEEIRTELPERVEKLAGNWAEIRTVSTAQHAADLIDPEVDFG